MQFIPARVNVEPSLGELRERRVVVLLLHVLELLAREVDAVHLEIDLERQDHALEVVHVPEDPEGGLEVLLVVEYRGGDDDEVVVVVVVALGEGGLELRDDGLATRGVGEVLGELLQGLQGLRRRCGDLVQDDAELALGDVGSVEEDVAFQGDFAGGGLENGASLVFIYLHFTTGIKAQIIHLWYIDFLTLLYINNLIISYT